jgi:hypothetical protein
MSRYRVRKLSGTDLILALWAAAAYAQINQVTLQYTARITW